MRLARTRRPVQQRTPLEVLAVRPQRLPVRGDAHRMVRHLLQKPPGRMTSCSESRGLWWKVTPPLLGPYSPIVSEITWPFSTLWLSIRRRYSARKAALVPALPATTSRDAVCRPERGSAARCRTAMLPPSNLKSRSPKPEAHSLALRVRAHCQIDVVRLGQRKLRKELRLLHHVAEGGVVPLATAANSYEPVVRIQGSQFRQDDIRVHKPMERNLFLHHGQVPGRQSQMVSQRVQQLRSRLSPVASVLRHLHQFSEIVDELPQFFIHAQTLAAPARK